jgi:hypothetical protein
MGYFQFGKSGSDRGRVGSTTAPNKPHRAAHARPQLTTQPSVPLCTSLHTPYAPPAHAGCAMIARNRTKQRASCKSTPGRRFARISQGVQATRCQSSCTNHRHGARASVSFTGCRELMTFKGPCFPIPLLSRAIRSLTSFLDTLALPLPSHHAVQRSPS